MARRLAPTLTDYLLIAITPALIMILLGSLEFFLIEAFYGGDYATRLKYVFALFVFSAVLIGRISIQEGREYSVLFAIPLALAVLAAVMKFGELSAGEVPLCIGVIAIVWWAADKLTWDCTVLDEADDEVGQGLLHTAGLDGTNDDTADHTATTSPTDAPPLSLWQRFLAHRRRPHAHGVWVVYVSLACLPVFGIGQWFIPAADISKSRSVFWQFTFFLLAAFGLLLATSFLGLRRYLRSRRLEMPLEMAGTWLIVGTSLVVALLTLGALLPRPRDEFSVTQLAKAVPRDDIEPDKHGPGTDGPLRDQADRQRSDPTGKQETPADSGDGSSGTPQQKSGGSEKSDNDSESGQSQENSNTQQPPQTRDQGEGDSAREPESAPDPSDQSTRANESQSPQATDKNPASAEENNQTQPVKPPDEHRGDRPRQISTSVFNGALYLLKALYWLLFIGLAAFFAWRYRDQLVSAWHRFVRDLRAWLERLLGRGSSPESSEQTAAMVAPPPIPFSSFRNPFQAGGPQRSLPELIQYSFAALEAWGREHDCPRGHEQTPHEFAAQIATRADGLDRDARDLATLYCQSAFSSDPLPATAVEYVRRFWTRILAA